jgi:hypothetical protein
MHCAYENPSSVAGHRAELPHLLVRAADVRRGRFEQDGDAQPPQRGQQAVGRGQQAVGRRGGDDEIWR